MRMEQFSLGAVERHRGVVRGIQQHGNWLNFQTRRAVMRRLKNE